MNAYHSGANFSFMTKTSSAVLYTVAFGARCCHGNKVHLHSHLGKGFAGDWAMRKCCHMLFGQCFVWVTDCYAIKFILSYDGANPSILCLQMHLMGWDVDIVHRFCLGTNLCFDPLFKTYLNLTCKLHLENPPPTSFPMKSKNMPYYRGPKVIPARQND
jgi:hypothetical protein